MLALAVLVGLLGLAVVLRSGGVRVRPADQSRPGPVLLVPGYGGDIGDLAALAARLRDAGREVQLVSLPGDGTGDLRQAAAAIGRAVDRALAGGSGSVDLVGYSAGGVTVRVYVAHGGGSRVRRVVTLGSPHHGTAVAALALSFASGQCPTACAQLAPGSALLAGLADTPAGPRWVSVWTADDTVVTPPTSARLSGAVDVEFTLGRTRVSPWFGGAGAVACPLPS